MFEQRRKIIQDAQQKWYKSLTSKIADRLLQNSTRAVSWAFFTSTEFNCKHLSNHWKACNSQVMRQRTQLGNQVETGSRWQDTLQVCAEIPTRLCTLPISLF